MEEEVSDGVDAPVGHPGGGVWKAEEMQTWGRQEGHHGGESVRESPETTTEAAEGSPLGTVSSGGGRRLKKKKMHLQRKKPADSGETRAREHECQAGGVPGRGRRTVLTIVKRSARRKAEKWSRVRRLYSCPLTLTSAVCVVSKSQITGRWVEGEEAFAFGGHGIKVMFRCYFSR